MIQKKQMIHTGRALIKVKKYQSGLSMLEDNVANIVSVKWPNY